MRPLAYIALSFAPLLALGIYWYCRQSYEKPFLKLLVVSFLMGAAGIMVLLFAELLSTWLGLNNIRSLKRTLFYAFITIGGASELGKFFFFRCFILPDKTIDRPMLSILYAVMTSLGFSTLYLLFYTLDLFGTRSVFPTTLYVMIFVPANMMFGVIQGFFLGMAKFLKARFSFHMSGLMGAAFFHGFFNLCLLTGDYKLLSLFSFGAMVMVFILGLKAAYTKPASSP
jgi:RsiW-degrading membrane proteinase PrsW (M82 family)